MAKHQKDAKGSWPLEGFGAKALIVAGLIHFGIP